MTQVRHTTTVVLPQSETIVDVVAGDAEYWDVSAASNVAYIKPLEAGVASNVTLMAESGRVWEDEKVTVLTAAGFPEEALLPSFVSLVISDLVSGSGSSNGGIDEGRSAIHDGLSDSW